MKTFIYLLGSLCLLASCNTKEEVFTPEDYDTLFPFTGIDKPSAQFGQIVERQGDINMTAKTFKYLGTQSDIFQTEYDVVLTYALYEPNSPKGLSRIALRFVNENGQLVSIGSDEERRYMTADEYDNWDSTKPFPPIRYTMKSNGEENTITYRVKSGHQLLLCLTGDAPRGTWVQAEIVAKAIDGAYPPIRIGTSRQTQGSEGQASIPNPFCKYIILP